MVDAAYDKGGPLPGAQFAQGKLDAVYRRAVARPHLNALPLAAELEAQRRGGRESAGKTAAGRLWGAHEQSAEAADHADEAA